MTVAYKSYPLSFYDTEKKVTNKISKPPYTAVKPPGCRIDKHLISKYYVKKRAKAKPYCSFSQHQESAPGSFALQTKNLGYDPDDMR